MVQMCLCRMTASVVEQWAERSFYEVQSYRSAGRTFCLVRLMDTRRTYVSPRFTDDIAQNGQKKQENRESKKSMMRINTAITKGETHPGARMEWFV
jgi:hypothetical protein